MENLVAPSRNLAPNPIADPAQGAQHKLSRDIDTKRHPTRQLHPSFGHANIHRKHSNVAQSLWCNGEIVGIWLSPVTDSSQSSVIDFLTQSSLSHRLSILTQSTQHWVRGGTVSFRPGCFLTSKQMISPDRIWKISETAHFRFIWAQMYFSENTSKYLCWICLSNPKNRNIISCAPRCRCHLQIHQH